MLFDYEAMDSYGFEVIDYIEADSIEKAKDEIRKKGLFVTRIKEKELEVINSQKIGSEKRSEIWQTFVLMIFIFIFGLWIGRFL